MAIETWLLRETGPGKHLDVHLLFLSEMTFSTAS
jgi:hypothetical protein